MKEILIATTNVGKIKEYEKIFANFGYEVKSLLDYPEIPEVPEPYETFKENAQIKAETISKLLGIDVVSDDSGLCVKALNGAPGVHSARWTGVHRDYKSLNEKLLNEMTDKTDREAYYETVIAWASPTRKTEFFTGIMPLEVACEETTVAGFSYDSVVKFHGQYVSEMSEEDKNKNSSRYHAVVELLKSFGG